MARDATVQIETDVQGGAMPFAVRRNYKEMSNVRVSETRTRFRTY